MKAAVYYGPRDIRVKDVSAPKLEADGIMIRVRACGICGSDLHPYKLGGQVLGLEPGRAMGHGRSAVGPP
jgi:threonine dehydrogenase-like Zn-dependent dehydrogenase